MTFLSRQMVVMGTKTQRLEVARYSMRRLLFRSVYRGRSHNTSRVRFPGFVCNQSTKMYMYREEASAIY